MYDIKYVTLCVVSVNNVSSFIFHLQDNYQLYNRKQIYSYKLSFKVQF